MNKIQRKIGTKKSKSKERSFQLYKVNKNYTKSKTGKAKIANNLHAQSMNFSKPRHKSSFHGWGVERPSKSIHSYKKDKKTSDYQSARSQRQTLMKKKERSQSRPFTKDDHYKVKTQISNLKKFNKSAKRKVGIMMSN